MNYNALFKHVEGRQPVRAGIIGTGHFATAILSQSQRIQLLEVPVIADISLENALQALANSGISKDRYSICDTKAAADAALTRGHIAVLQDPLLMMELPIDVVVEATGVPEAGARHGEAAIRHGKHLAMVTKEVDATVGPILKHRADLAGLVYTAVDGDQHGLLVKLMSWVQLLGLEVICGGKAIEFDLVFDPETGVLQYNELRRTVSPDEASLFAPLVPGEGLGRLQERRTLLGEMGALEGYDVVEMTIAANSTGALPDVDALHCPVVRTPEIPEVLCLADEGGILSKRGVIDCVACLRHPQEAGLGGGVFVVVACENDYSRHILLTKGIMPNRRGTAGLIVQPYHLCGVETPISILSAGLLGLPTGATELLQRYDVVAEAASDFAIGELAPGDKSRKLKALMQPASDVGPDTVLPLQMARGNRFRRSVRAGDLLTMDMVEEPPDSVLWALRREQDKLLSRHDNNLGSVRVSAGT